MHVSGFAKKKNIRRPDKTAKTIMAETNPNHIICGRGPRCYNHEGNMKFRDIIEKNVLLYRKSTKSKKSKIIDAVLDEIKGKDMKFVEDNNREKAKELSIDESRKKISHRFRDFTRFDNKRKAQNSPTSSKKSTDDDMSKASSMRSNGDDDEHVSDSEKKNISDKEVINLPSSTSLYPISNDANFPDSSLPDANLPGVADPSIFVESQQYFSQLMKALEVETCFSSINESSIRFPKKVSNTSDSKIMTSASKYPMNTNEDENSPDSLKKKMFKPNTTASTFHHYESIRSKNPQTIIDKRMPEGDNDDMKFEKIIETNTNDALFETTTLLGLRKKKDDSSDTDALLLHPAAGEIVISYKNLVSLVDQCKKLQNDTGHSAHEDQMIIVSSGLEHVPPSKGDISSEQKHALPSKMDAREKSPKCVTSKDETSIAKYRKLKQ